MTSNKNTIRQRERRSLQRQRNLEAIERGEVETQPLDEAARSGLFRFLNAAEKYTTRRAPGFVIGFAD
jgi:hypothetical protein